MSPAGDALLAELRSALELFDPVPPALLAAGRSAIGRRRPGALRAERVRDSDLAGAASGVRGGARLLTFAGRDGTGRPLSIDIEVTGAGRERHVVGRLEPAGPAALRLLHRDGEQIARVGAEGHFVLSGVPPGPVSLLFTLPDATSIVTSWVRL